MPKALTGPELLLVEIESKDLDTTLTLADYFKTLLKKMWEDGSNFDGKRPFGSSGWKLDVMRGLVKAGVIDGKLDSDGFLDSYDKTADQLVLEAIGGLI